MASINDLPSLWQQQDVGVGLQYTSKLLNDIVGLATQSPNHSLKAQHLLSRGIEILASIQQFLTTGTDDFLEAIKTIQSLEVTESVLVESITVLNEDVKNPVPSDRAVLSSWHLNRNTFSSQLKRLSTTGPTQPDAAWTGVLKDVVRADDLNWATRLVEDMATLEDQGAKQSLGTIISTLEQPEQPETFTPAETELIQTDSVLAIMCLADEVARPSSESGRTEVVKVVNAMASELKKSEGRNWKSLSDRLHNLPVCRQVEKPLLVHQGSYSIPDIVDDVQAEVDIAGARIMDLIPFGSKEADIEDSRREEAKKHLWQVERAMKDAAGHLKALNARGHSSFKGEKSDSWISYAAARLLTNTALAITPASEISTFIDPLSKIVSTVSGFIDALGVFDLGPTQSWKEAFTRSLGGTASLLTQFGRSNVNIGSPLEATFGGQSRAGPNVPTGSSTPERTSVKEEKHGIREKMADLASTVKDKLPGGKSS